MPERIGAWRMHVKRRVVGELQSSPIDPGARKLTAQQAMAKAGPSYAQAHGELNTSCPFFLGTIIFVRGRENAQALCLRRCWR